MIINCRGRLLDLTSPKVMGILNVTPDSFYDGGRYESDEGMEARVQQMISEGVDIIDIGGMSSKPGSDIISVEEEIKRIAPSLQYVSTFFPKTFISIDTLNGPVAEYALKNGAHIVNDISGGNHDPEIIDVAIRNDAPYIMMHMQGTPKTMQDAPSYKDVVLEILTELNSKIKKYHSKGLKDIIVDPGFGFGKSVEHNYQLLNKLAVFKITDCPILVGISRKSMLYKPLEIQPSEALNATSAAHMIALTNGAKILRVHDVKAAQQCLSIYSLATANN